MSMMRGWIVVAMVAFVAGCSGGGSSCDAGTPPFGSASSPASSSCPSSTSTTATQLSLDLSATNIDNSGARTITAKATATSAGGQTIAGVPVTFSVDNNAIYTP